MNGYDLTAQWFAYVEERPDWVDTNVSALYFAILHRCNELRWKSRFQLPARDMMERIGIRSPKTYYPAFEKLVKAGFITIIEEAKNQFTACIIQVNAEVNFTEATTSASTSAGEHQVPQQGNSMYPGSGNKDKQENKETKQTKKTNKQPATPDIAQGFEVFWNLYGKKEDRAKCLKKWQALTDEQRQVIVATIPGYVASKPDPQFRKNPLTYLNGQCWLDEGTKTPIYPLNSSASTTIQRPQASGIVR